MTPSAAHRLEARARSLQGPNRETERRLLMQRAAQIRTQSRTAEK